MFRPLISVFLCLLIMACQSGGDDKAKLEDLKSQRDDLNKEIAELEKKLEGSDTSASDVKLKDVSISEIQKDTFRHFIEIQGKVDADQNITLSPKMPGTITSIYVTEGSAVRSGQTLAQIDDQQILLGIDELKTSLDLATLVYEKQKNLWDQKIGTEIQFLTAKSNKESLEKRLASMYEQLNNTRIKSPINGTVDEVMIKLGQAVAPGIPAIRVVNFSNLKVKAEVAESYANRIKQGNEVVVYFPDLKSEMKSRISFVGRVIDPLNRTFRVEVNLESKSQYSPNMIAVLKVIDYRSDSAVVVPVNVLRSGEAGNYLFVAEKDSEGWAAKRRDVTVGQSYSGQAEVLEGLKTGDRLITSGYQDLKDGQRLKI